MHCFVIALMVLIVSIEGATYKKRESLDAHKTNRIVRGTKGSTESDVLDLMFQFGDSNKDNSLDEREVRKLFCGKEFAASINDIIIAIMSRDSNKSNGIDLQEWRSIQFSKTELETFQASPYITILA